MNATTSIASSLNATPSPTITSNIAKSIGTVVASTIALNFFYAFGEWIGKKAFTLSGGRISDLEIPEPFARLSNLYGEKTVKRILTYVINREGEICNKLFLESHRANPTSLKTKLLMKGVISPLITITVLSPILEEIFYRLPLTYLKSGIVKTIAIAASSIAFASAHQGSQPGRTTALVTMGLFLTWITENFDLPTAILAHAGYNLLNWVIEL